MHMHTQRTHTHTHTYTHARTHPHTRAHAYTHTAGAPTQTLKTQVTASTHSLAPPQLLVAELLVFRHSRKGAGKCSVTRMRSGVVCWEKRVRWQHISSRCVCVCVCKMETETQRGRDTQGTRAREREREREREIVCACNNACLCILCQKDACGLKSTFSTYRVANAS